MKKYTVDQIKYKTFLRSYMEYLTTDLKTWADGFNYAITMLAIDEEMFVMYSYKYYYDEYKELKKKSKYEDLKLYEDISLLFRCLSNESNIDDKEILIYFLQIFKRLSFLGNKIFSYGYESCEVYDDYIDLIPCNYQEKEDSQPMPFKIALLSELGFFNLPALKYMNKSKQHEIIKILIGGDERSIKGNISVLDPNSEENRLKYTSNNHLEAVKKYLK